MRAVLLRTLTSLPILVGAWVYFAAAGGTYLFGLTPRELALGLFCEFVGVHSVPFGMCLILMKPKDWKGHLTRWGILAALFGAYALFAWEIDEWTGVAMVWAFAIGTYMGPLVRRPDEGWGRAFVVRWIANFLLFMAVMMVVAWATGFEGDNYVDAPMPTQCIFLGTFLSILGLLEIVGAYDFLVARAFRLARAASVARPGAAARDEAGDMAVQAAGGAPEAACRARLSSRRAP